MSARTIIAGLLTAAGALFLADKLRAPATPKPRPEPAPAPGGRVAADGAPASYWLEGPGEKGPYKWWLNLGTANAPGADATKIAAAESVMHAHAAEGFYGEYTLYRYSPPEEDNRDHETQLWSKHIARLVRK